MRFTKALVAACVLGAASIAIPAEAKVYDFTFTGSNYTFDGSFTTAATANADGTFDITSGTGALVSAASGQPVGPVSLFPGSGTTPDGLENYSNLYNATSKTFAGQGVQFMNAAKTFGANIYDVVDSGYTPCPTTCLSITPNTGFYNPGDTGVLTISAVPEPATWALLFLGFGFVGWTLRGSRRTGLTAV